MMYLHIIYLFLPSTFCLFRDVFFVEDKTLSDHLYNGVFLLEDVDSSLSCALQCLAMVECKSVFYHYGTSNCRLHSAVMVNTSQMTTSTGWKYYKRISDLSCPTNVSMPTAIVTIPAISKPGDNIAYQCAAGFQFQIPGYTGQISCQPNGTWSPPSNPCIKCTNYSTNYELRSGMYLFPPQPIMSWYPTQTGSNTTITAAWCKQQCAGRTDFKCVATYYKPGYCLHTWIRVEDNINLYSPYYYSNTVYDEYIRLCL